MERRIARNLVCVSRTKTTGLYILQTTQDKRLMARGPNVQFGESAVHLAKMSSCMHVSKIRHDAHEACQAWRSTAMGKRTMGGTKGALS